MTAVDPRRATDAPSEPATRMRLQAVRAVLGHCPWGSSYEHELEALDKIRAYATGEHDALLGADVDDDLLARLLGGDART